MDAKSLVDALLALYQDPVSRCDFCDLPLLDAKTFSDAATMDAGLGVELCSRTSCIQEREAMPLRERLNIYLAMECEEYR